MRNTYSVKGMFCPNCEKRIDRAVSQLAGVHSVKSDYQKQEMYLEYDEDVFDHAALQSTIESLGYELSQTDTLQLISILIIILSLYVILKHFGLLQIFNAFPGIETSFSLGTVFVTGLLTSVHCVAMCGGFVLTQSVLSARNNGSVISDNLKYNTGRLISYTLIGAAAGALGQLISFSGILKGAIASAAGIMMMIMAFNMLGIFRRFGRFRFPLIGNFYQSLKRLFRKRSSFLIGLLNGFMPCGPLQAMKIYALSSGSAVKGALALLAFGLGTSPLLYGFGFVSGKINRQYTRLILSVSAFVIFAMGLNMFSNGLSLSGLSSGIFFFTETDKKAVLIDEKQMIQTEVDYGSYESFTIRNNIPVEWIIYVPEGRLNGCNSEILVPEYNLDIHLHEGENLVTFTPEKTGEIPYSCWMGMIRSTIQVID